MIRLYRARFSTNVERVALTLGLKGLEAESVWITDEDRSIVERVSGQPLVPVLDYDGEIRVESMDIVRFLDERHPEPPLYPDDPSGVDSFITWFNDTWKVPPNQIVAEGFKPEPDVKLMEQLHATMISRLDGLDATLSGQDYVCGDDLTAADICAFPFLKYATLYDPEDDEPFHVVLRRQCDGKDRPGLAAWIDRVNALPRA